MTERPMLSWFRGVSSVLASTVAIRPWESGQRGFFDTGLTTCTGSKQLELDHCVL